MKHKAILVAALAAAVSLPGCGGRTNKYLGMSCTALKLEVEAHMSEMRKDNVNPNTALHRQERGDMAAAWDYGGCPGPSGF